MNISQLEYLLEAIRQKSFTKTAQELFVTPQAISRSIKELEKELGVVLFESRGRRVEPTQLALDLYPYIETALEGIFDLKTIAQTFSITHNPSNSLTVAIASTPCRGSYVNHSALELFSKRNERITTSFRFFSNESCIAAVEEDIVDTAIVVGNYSSTWNCSSIHIANIEPRIVLSKTNELSSKMHLAFKDTVGMKIALPVDIKTCYPAIRHQFEKRNLGVPEFVDVKPTFEDHILFLKNGGLVFVAHEPAISSDKINTTTKQLCNNDAYNTFKLPLFLLYKNEHWSMPLAAFVSFWLGPL